MSCEPKLILIVIAGFVSGTLSGFLFRDSDAERDQASRSGYRHPLMRVLYASVWSLSGLSLLIPALGLMFLVLWSPGVMFGVLPLCGPDFKLHQVALIVGAFFGWFLRWVLWKRYLQYL